MELFKANLVVTLKDEDTGAECQARVSVVRDESDTVMRSALGAMRELVRQMYGKNDHEVRKDDEGLGLAEAGPE